jgi:FkbM family methyltransferase
MTSILYRVKRVLYLCVMYILRFYWRFTGGRHIAVLGEKMVVTSDTIFPTYRKFPLQKGDCFSEIVRLTDYVQLHAIAAFLADKYRPVIVEVGAHHGAYAVIIGKLIKKSGGILIAIEPDYKSFASLIKNVELNNLNDTVLCLNVAVSDRVGTQYLNPAETQSRLSNDAGPAGYKVQVETLSKTLADRSISYVDLLIIDVEGAELPVLNGFPWGDVGINAIFCELHPYAWRDFGYSGSQMSKFLMEHNYKAIDMYFREHVLFDSDVYIGPTRFLQASDKHAGLEAHGE